MNAPISVIIPCYCCINTIERAIDSVLYQTLPVSEIILVDDHSADSSLSFTKALVDRLQDPRITLIAMHMNSGPGISRNIGWDKSTQPWIAFLDADDAWHSRKIELCWEWIQNHPETILLGHKTAQFDTDNDWKNLPLTKSVKAAQVSFADMLIANRFYTRTVILKRDISFRFADRCYAEDYLLWLELILAQMPGYVLNQTLAFSFRPEFSPGGYSGHLWAHEKRELRSWVYLYKSKKISILTLGLALLWSYIKFLRRTIKGYFS